MQVITGDQFLAAPGVQILTAMHPTDWKERASGLKFANPISTGSDVWIGGAIICPGVIIGSHCIIDGGSVVTKDIPDDVFAASNPCRVIRPLEK